MKVYLRITDDKDQTYEGIAVLTKSKKNTKQKQPMLQTKTKPKGATSLINLLYLEKYFEKSRTLNDVEIKIKSMKYNFAITSIASSLQRSKYLKKQGQIGKYSFIQKAPPS